MKSQFLLTGQAWRILFAHLWFHCYKNCSDEIFFLWQRFDHFCWTCFATKRCQRARKREQWSITHHDHNEGMRRRKMSKELFAAIFWYFSQKNFNYRLWILVLCCHMYWMIDNIHSLNTPSIGVLTHQYLEFNPISPALQLSTLSIVLSWDVGADQFEDLRLVQLQICPDNQLLWLGNWKQRQGEKRGEGEGWQEKRCQVWTTGSDCQVIPREGVLDVIDSNAAFHIRSQLFWLLATDDQFISKFMSTLSAVLLWSIYGNLRLIKIFQLPLPKMTKIYYFLLAGAAHDAVSRGVPGGVDVTRGNLHAPRWAQPFLYSYLI